MEALVKLSFYSFTAASIALVAASVCYIVQAVGRVRVRRAALATSTGTTVTTHSAEFGPGSESLGRYGTMLGWFGVFFQGLSILLRSLAAEAGPSNMYEFSLVFIFAVGLIYLLFERTYGVQHLGAIVMPIAVGMAAYVYSLPASEREVDPAHPGPPEPAAA